MPHSMIHSGDTIDLLPRAANDTVSPDERKAVVRRDLACGLRSRGAYEGWSVMAGILWFLLRNRH